MVKLCLVSYSVCPRNHILLGIYMAVCYRIVKSVGSLFESVSKSVDVVA